MRYNSFPDHLSVPFGKTAFNFPTLPLFISRNSPSIIFLYLSLLPIYFSSLAITLVFIIAFYNLPRPANFLVRGTTPTTNIITGKPSCASPFREMSGNLTFSPVLSVHLLSLLLGCFVSQSRVVVFLYSLAIFSNFGFSGMEEGRLIFFSLAIDMPTEFTLFLNEQFVLN